MWSRYLSISILFVSAALAQDRFVAVGANVLRVSRDNTLTRVLQLDPVESNLRLGSTGPRISPDQHWIAYVKDHKAWIRPTTGGQAIRLTSTGSTSDGKYLPIAAFLVGFTPDSKQLMYSIAPGQDDCPECDRPDPVPQKADYGFFLFSLSSRQLIKLQPPGDTRVLDIPARNRLFIASVGAYSDVLGFLEFPSRKFEALPPKCASASNCVLTAGGRVATCIQIGNDHSQIVECDMARHTDAAVSPQGTCITEFQQPSRSPAANHIAYLQTPERCGSPNRVLWIDQKPRFQCQKAEGYAWIDETRLLVQCGQEFVAVDIQGNRLSAIPISKK
jgi:hypothetical protein